MPLGIAKKLLLGFVLGTTCLMSLSLESNAQSTMMKSNNQPSAAQTSSHVNVRGTIESIAGKTLVIKTLEGGETAITLADDLTVNTVTKASIAQDPRILHIHSIEAIS